MDNYTDLLVDTIIQMSFEVDMNEISPIVKDCLLDYIAVLYGGEYELHDKVKSYLTNVKSMGTNTFFKYRDISEYDSALILGMCSHYYDLDDGSRFGFIHVGSIVFSALLPFFQNRDISSELFYKSVFIGYEVSLLLAYAVQPNHKKKGFHSSGTCSCIGAVAGLCIALSLDKQQIKNCISAAVASVSGLLEMISDTSELKPFNIGKAAQNAILAIYMGMSDFQGPVDALGGKNGFLNVMCDDVDFFKYQAYIKNYKYLIKTTYKKNYASCRHCHPSVEAVLKLQKENEIVFDDIKSIKIETYDLAINGHDHTVINGVGAAKMSIPYSVSASLFYKSGGIRTISKEAIGNEKILNLLNKISIAENEEYSKLVPNKRKATVTIELLNKKNYSETITYPKGEPENPLSELELKEKFITLMNHANVSEQKIDLIYTSIHENEMDVKTIINLITE